MLASIRYILKLTVFLPYSVRLPFYVSNSASADRYAPFATCMSAAIETSCNTNAAKYFYTNRIVLAWNSLTDTVVTGPSMYRPKCFQKATQHY